MSASYTVTWRTCAEQLVHMGFNIDPNWIPPLAGCRITIAEIQAAVAAKFAIPESEMRSERRSQDVARPRQVAMYLSRALTPRSIPQIGRAFNRDHTTVLHGMRRVKELMEVDGELASQISALTSLLSQPKPRPRQFDVPAQEPEPDPVAPGKVWCEQCSRNVSRAEVEGCGSKWCGAKGAGCG